MPQVQPRLNFSFPLVDAQGYASDAFREWATRVSRSVPIVGTGSPEGVVDAAQYSWYIDETTPSTPVVYVKMQTAIAGDPLQGWAVI